MINKYKIIKQLKQYIYDVEYADNDKFDRLITEIKDYIFSIDFLRSAYNSKITSLKDIIITKDFMVMINSFAGKVEDVFKRVGAKVSNEFIDCPQNFYYLFLGEQIFDLMLNANQKSLYPIYKSKGVWKVYSDLIIRLFLLKVTKMKDNDKFKLGKFSFDYYWQIIDDILGDKIDFYFVDMEDSVYNLTQEKEFGIYLFKVATIRVLSTLKLLVSNSESFKNDKIIKYDDIKINLFAHPELKLLTKAETEVFIDIIFYLLNVNEISEKRKVKVSSLRTQIANMAQKLELNGLKDIKIEYINMTDVFN